MCGEFLWATADRLFDDEISLSLFSLFPLLGIFGSDPALKQEKPPHARHSQ